MMKTKIVLRFMLILYMYFACNILVSRLIYACEYVMFFLYCFFFC